MANKLNVTFKGDTTVDMKPRFRIIWCGGPPLSKELWAKTTGSIVWVGKTHFIVEYQSKYLRMGLPLNQ